MLSFTSHYMSICTKMNLETKNKEPAYSLKVRYRKGGATPTIRLGSVRQGRAESGSLAAPEDWGACSPGVGRKAFLRKRK